VTGCLGLKSADSLLLALVLLDSFMMYRYLNVPSLSSPPVLEVVILVMLSLLPRYLMGKLIERHLNRL
jgi:hypothetical protein